MEIEYKFSLFFGQRVQYWNLEHNTANIVCFSANQIADILYIGDRKL